MTRHKKVRWPEPSSCPLNTRLATGVDLSFSSSDNSRRVAGGQVSAALLALQDCLLAAVDGHDELGNESGPPRSPTTTLLLLELL